MRIARNPNCCFPGAQTYGQTGVALNHPVQAQLMFRQWSEGLSLHSSFVAWCAHALLLRKPAASQAIPRIAEKSGKKEQPKVPTIKVAEAILFWPRSNFFLLGQVHSWTACPKAACACGRPRWDPIGLQQHERRAAPTSTSSAVQSQEVTVATATVGPVCAKICSSLRGNYGFRKGFRLESRLRTGGTSLDAM